MARQATLSRAYDEIAHVFAGAPTQEQILRFRLSEPARERVRELGERNEAGALTPDERAELDALGELNLFLEYVRSIILRERGGAA